VKSFVATPLWKREPERLTSPDNNSNMRRESNTDNKKKKTWVHLSVFRYFNKNWTTVATHDWFFQKFPQNMFKLKTLVALSIFCP